MSTYKTIEGVKEDILSRFPIFLPRKKEEPEQATLARKSTAKVLIRNTTAKVAN